MQSGNNLRLSFQCESSELRDRVESLKCLKVNCLGHNNAYLQIHIIIANTHYYCKYTLLLQIHIIIANMHYC